MNCPSCGETMQTNTGFCVNCRALVNDGAVVQKHDIQEIIRYRDRVILPKSRNAKRGKYPQVNALCACWRVCTRDAFGSDVNGYVSSLTKPSLAVMTAVIAGGTRSAAVDGYLKERTPLWHDQLIMETPSAQLSDPGTKSYLQEAVQFGGDRSGILTPEYEVRDSIGPLLKCFLPALVISYDLDLSEAYDQYEYLVGDYEYDRLDELQPY